MGNLEKKQKMANLSKKYVSNKEIMLDIHYYSLWILCTQNFVQFPWIFSELCLFTFQVLQKKTI